jgi:hypothetical protein
LLYPNPYPKKSRLKHRLYAHPAFPLLMMTLTADGEDVDDAGGGGELIVRSNWRGYLGEFKVAVDIWIEFGSHVNEWDGIENATRDGDGELSRDARGGRSPAAVWKTIGPTVMSRDDRFPMTNFEAKFLECGEPIYELSVRRMPKSGSLLYHSEDDFARGGGGGGGQNLG